MIFSKNKCYLCGSELELKYNLCPICQKHLVKAKIIKDLHLEYLDKIFVAYKYQGVIRDMILDFKFRDKTYLYKGLGDLVADIIRENQLTDYDYICPIPMKGKDLRARGYNQAYEMGKRAEALTNIDCIELLYKVKDTKRQVDLGYIERRKNLKEAFECRCDLSKKKVIILDDILTSGATADEAARALKEKGAEDVAFVAPCSGSFY
ncbi:ComF family protein [Peptoniphilus sp. GNH]|nr:ComF family protein [Peptoniphilus sp. GNH]